jgi:protein-L-isoaspartate(D-aspartate) O-methyltransferase
MTPFDLDACRASYAAEIRAVAGIRSEALVAAFARVPRERFLGDGPWLLADARWPVSVEYRPTPDADPRQVYHNVVVALDPARQLNNGHPSALASWMDAADLRSGDRVLHVGCGTGYYTAIMAEVVGADGRVLAVELDPALAERARVALAPWAQVCAHAGDGGAAFGEQDVVFVNAGATHPRAEWLDALAPGGRLLVPLTVAGGLMGSGGFMFRLERRAGGLAMRAVSGVQIFDCAGARDAEAEKRLRAAYGRAAWRDVRSLRREAHPEGPGCLLHAPDGCWSAAEIAAGGEP